MREVMWQLRRTFEVLAACILIFIGYSYWPEDHNAREAKALIRELNDFFPDRIDRVEFPERYPGIRGSGELEGFIHSRKEELARRGYSAFWDRKQQMYLLRRRPVRDVWKSLFRCLPIPLQIRVQSFGVVGPGSCRPTNPLTGSQLPTLAVNDAVQDCLRLLHDSALPLNIHRIGRHTIASRL